MSDNPTRWTIRLTEEDERLLAALCQAYDMKRPDAVRRAIREALVAGKRSTRNATGAFIALSSSHRLLFPVRLKRKADHEHE